MLLLKHSVKGISMDELEKAYMVVIEADAEVNECRRNDPRFNDLARMLAKAKAKLYRAQREDDGRARKVNVNWSSETSKRLTGTESTQTASTQTIQFSPSGKTVIYPNKEKAFIALANEPRDISHVEVKALPNGSVSASINYAVS